MRIDIKMVELSHRLRPIGSQFDENGNLRNWWTEETYDKFDEKAECFINEYNSYVDPQAKLHVSDPSPSDHLN